MKISIFSVHSKKQDFLFTLTCACAGGILFWAAQLPLPWLLGPMAAVIIFSRFPKAGACWPVQLRDAGLIIVGYSLGLSFTRDAVIGIGWHLPAMFASTVLLILFCAVMAFITSRVTGFDYPAILLGSIPGGLSQIVALAEEIKGINISIVAFMQVSRLIMIVSLIPLLIYSPLFGGHRGEGHEAVSFEESSPLILLLFSAACIAGALLAKKWKLPTPFLLGPMAGAAILVLLGIDGVSLPGSVMNFSQFLIGGYVGLLVKPGLIQKKVQFSVLSLLNGLFLIGGSFLISLVLTRFYSFSPVTSYLSTAPGGMDQMGIIAHDVKADLSVVTAFQLFRIFFIYFVVPPLLKTLFAKLRKKETAKSRS
ncbi:AbrB family transcriptional regulator [Peribacillus sp. SCS-37]|uniref:AbrB family transcriptional regulator n=1 Tax=Paraperibacillus esterisolvens TaxID=3115296 RepID=UPI003905EF5D